MILILLYWLTAIIGLFDLEFFDIELDVDGGEGGGLFDALALFLRIGEVPFGLVLSLIILNFWILSMFLYFLPVSPETALYAVLLIPVLALALVLTRFEIIPLRGMFKSVIIPNDLEHKVMDRRCVLLSDVSEGRMGQARIKQRGAGIVINVMSEFEKESFVKDEVAYVFRKDKDKDLYYITKPIFNITDTTEEK